MENECVAGVEIEADSEIKRDSNIEEVETDTRVREGAAVTKMQIEKLRKEKMQIGERSRDGEIQIY